MGTLLYTTISEEDFLSRIDAAVTKAVEKRLGITQDATSPAQEYITRKEAAQLLSVSLKTLNEWTKEGKVIGYRISSRVRYKRTELEQSLNKIKSVRQTV